MRRRLKELNKQVSQHDGRVSAFLQETIEKLLMGIFRPESGRLYLQGAEQLTLDRSTRRLFAYVPQGNLLQRIRALPDRTCIAVTHRSAAIDLCDWRLEVLDGKIRTVKNEI